MQREGNDGAGGERGEEGSYWGITYLWCNGWWALVPGLQGGGGPFYGWYFGVGKCINRHGKANSKRKEKKSGQEWDFHDIYSFIFPLFFLPVLGRAAGGIFFLKACLSERENDFSDEKLV